MFDQKKYLNLLCAIAPKPIESEEQYDSYLVLVEPLLFGKDRSPEELAISKILVLLIKDYEEKHYPIDDPQPLDYLLLLMENRGLTHRDLVSVIGNENLTKLILNGACEIDKAIAKVLGEYFETDYKDFL